MNGFSRQSGGFRGGCIFLSLVLLGWSLLGVGEGSAMELGRLFTTPEVRQTLDRLRQKPLQDAPATEEELIPGEAPKAEKTAPTRIALRGLMIRGKGGKVVWLDHFNTLRGETVTPEGVRLLPEKSSREGVALTLPNDPDHIFWLKPGQVLDGKSGEIFEGFVAPGTPAPASASPGTPDPASAPASAQGEGAEKNGGKPNLPAKEEKSVPIRALVPGLEKLLPPPIK